MSSNFIPNPSIERSLILESISPNNENKSDQDKKEKEEILKKAEHNIEIEFDQSDHVRSD